MDDELLRKIDSLVTTTARASRVSLWIAVGALLVATAQTAFFCIGRFRHRLPARRRLRARLHAVPPMAKTYRVTTKLRV
jgi:hypothetical protein